MKNKIKVVLAIVGVFLIPGLITWALFLNSGLGGYELASTRGIFGMIAYMVLFPMLLSACISYFEQYKIG